MTLGVEPESNEATIKKAYRKLALKYHPDKNKATPTLFQTVQGAHVSLFSNSTVRTAVASCSTYRTFTVNTINNTKKKAH